MHSFLIQAESDGRTQALLAWVAGGSPEQAEAVALGELHRNGWRVLTVVDPATVRQQFPGLKRLAGASQAMAAARQRGCAWMVLGEAL